MYSGRSVEVTGKFAVVSMWYLAKVESMMFEASIQSVIIPSLSSRSRMIFVILRIRSPGMLGRAVPKVRPASI